MIQNRINFFRIILFARNVICSDAKNVKISNTVINVCQILPDSYQDIVVAILKTIFYKETLVRNALSRIVEHALL